MISFNKLGNKGRLGNQMFQYAGLKGIATQKNYEFCIPLSGIFGTNDERVQASDVNLYNFPNIINNNVGMTTYETIEEKSFCFDSDLFHNCRDNINLFGYFQTEKYFKHIENQIREDFSFGSFVDGMCGTYLQGMFKDSEVVSLHIRRTDYVTDSNFHLLDFGYYQSALEELDVDLPIMVFSDDPEWCEKQFFFKNERFKISKSNNTLVDLCLMSKCNYHIIANSSYSWWGAWLANSKKVIAPKKWFSGSLSDWDTKDLYCSGWVNI
jgi:hypothetical protein